VICTHLHVDHVGWNTMLVDGRWVPTFPNARYLFVRSEYDHWQADENVQSGHFADSVRPVVDAGLVEWTDPDARITDQVFLQPSFGHTPGHVCVRVADGDDAAVVTGDLMHHPVQCARPDWSTTFDVDADGARTVRQEFLDRHAGTSTLVFGTHFASPSAGHIVRDGAAWRFDC
jgi:glyoxylase-like metal-dependent hydrolase (beta-lactamase superfamily II)